MQKLGIALVTLVKLPIFLILSFSQVAAALVNTMPLHHFNSQFTQRINGLI